MSKAQYQAGGLIGLCMTCLCGAAASGQMYQAAIGSINFETINDIIATRDCGFQVVGREQSPALNTRFATARLDANGNVLWARSYALVTGTATIGHTVFESVSSGDLFLGGESPLTPIAPTRRKHIMRVDPAGTQLWSILLPGQSGLGSIAPTTPGLGVSVAEVADQRVASISRITNVNAVIRVGVLSVVDRNGNLAYSKRYIPAGGDSTELDFAQVRAAKFPKNTTDMLVVGNINSGTGVYGAFAMRTDASGNVLWAFEYQHEDGGISITADGFALDSRGNILFSGRRGPAIPNQLSPTQGIVGKIDATTGSPIWATNLDGFLNGYQAIAATAEDGLIVAGDYKPGPNQTNASVVAVDSSGAVIQQRVYGSSVLNAVVHANAVVNASPWGGYAIAGVTDEFGHGGTFDNLLIKTNPFLESGCHEDRVDPNPVSVKLNEKERFPQTVEDPAYLQQPALEVVLSWGPIFDCFRPLCLGDLNGDFLVDDADFVMFAGAYDILVCPTNPALTCCPADLNHDGLVDDADFVLFAAAYDALLCP